MVNQLPLIGKLPVAHAVPQLRWAQAALLLAALLPKVGHRVPCSVQLGQLLADVDQGVAVTQQALGEAVAGRLVPGRRHQGARRQTGEQDSLRWHAWLWFDSERNVPSA